jgi:hypothetical protein
MWKGLISGHDGEKNGNYIDIAIDKIALSCPLLSLLACYDSVVEEKTAPIVSLVQAEARYLKTHSSLTSF